MSGCARDRCTPLACSRIRTQTLSLTTTVFALFRVTALSVEKQKRNLSVSVKHVVNRMIKPNARSIILRADISVAVEMAYFHVS